MFKLSRISNGDPMWWSFEWIPKSLKSDLFSDILTTVVVLGRSGFAIKRISCVPSPHCASIICSPVQASPFPKCGRIRKTSLGEWTWREESIHKEECCVNGVWLLHKWCVTQMLVEMMFAAVRWKSQKQTVLFCKNFSFSNETITTHSKTPKTLREISQVCTQEKIFKLKDGGTVSLDWWYLGDSPRFRLWSVSDDSPWKQIFSEASESFFFGRFAYPECISEKGYHMHVLYIYIYVKHIDIL